jgi:hypothetical protein
LLENQKSPETQKKANQRELVWGELVKAKKIDDDPDFLGSELREDQSPCAKKLFFIETNHIYTEFLQKTDSQRLLRPWLHTSASLMFFGQIFEKSALGFNLHRSQRFLYGVYWDQDQQLKHPENAGNLI